MIRVRISEPTHWHDREYKAGDVIEVPERIQELNDGWMTPTPDEITPADSRPTLAEVKAKRDKAAADEAKKAEKERQKAEAEEAKANEQNNEVK